MEFTTCMHVPTHRTTLEMTDADVKRPWLSVSRNASLSWMPAVSCSLRFG